MFVLSICNHKGGTGKTTSTMNLAAALGLSGYEVLVIDLDPQGFLTRMMGLEQVPAAKSSLALFDHEMSFASLPRDSVTGFDLVPSSLGLTKRMRSLNKPTDVLWAKEIIEQNDQYDVILFDTAAAVTVYSLNALVASQHVVIPVTPEYQPVIGAEQTFQTVGMVRERLNPDLHPPRFLFTQVDARKSTHHKYRRYMRKRYRDLVMTGVIRTSAALAATYEDGTTVFQHDPHSRGALDYANATDELLQYIQSAEAEDSPDVPSEMPVPEDGAGSALNGSQNQPKREHPALALNRPK